MVGRPDAGVTADAGRLRPPEISDHLGEVGERAQLPAEGSEPSGRFGVVGRPGVAFSSSAVQVVLLFFEVADRLVEVASFGCDGFAVGGFGRRFLVRRAGGFPFRQ